MGSPPMRTALVTGGGRGIGRASALALARSGHHLCLTYVRDRDAASSAADLARESGVNAHLIEADLGVPKDVERCWGEAHRALGRVDVFVANAGIAPLTPLDEISLEEWGHVMDVNLRSAMLLGRLCLADMKSRAFGRIVTIASQAGVTGGFFVGAHYAASKGALIALTKHFAKQGAAHGVTANCVVPGLIDTDLTRAFPADRRAGLINSIPMRRMGTADEVAGLVSFLASDIAGYMSGAVIPVDGALLAG